MAGARGLLRLTEVELCQVRGIGPARAAQVLAALELGRRTVMPDVDERRQFTTPRDLALWLVPKFGAHPVEQFGIVLLDTKYRCLATRIISSGALDRSPAPARDVFREAVAVRAAFVVVFHNHPSGDASPSEEDAALTIHLTDAAELLGIGLLDHLILTATGYFSFKERSDEEPSVRAAPAATTPRQPAPAVTGLQLSFRTMRILYFDCFNGASGDMILGALLDAGVPLEGLRAALGSLAIDGYDVAADRVLRAGVSATKFRVIEGATAKASHCPSPSPPRARPRAPTRARCEPDDPDKCEAPEAPSPSPQSPGDCRAHRPLRAGACREGPRKGAL